MQALTWQTLLLQILLSSIPALVALVATYITLRHQRRVTADQAAAAATLKARELKFAAYTKQLDELAAAARSVADATAEFAVTAHVSEDRKDLAGAATRLFGVFFSQALQLPQLIDETEEELRSLGLGDKYKNSLEFVRRYAGADFSQVDTRDPDRLLDYVNHQVIQPMHHILSMRRAILEARADELFGQYLPAETQKSIELPR